MSDIYSVPQIPAKVIQKASTVQWVNANTVFQRILQQLNAEDRKAIILRCDELPLLQGTEEDMEIIFAGLLQMILQRKKLAGKLFLHIHCKATFEEVRHQSGRNRYSIQFNTNLVPSADWANTNKKQLDELAARLQTNNGNLQIAESQGCIFSLSLPGKPL